MSDARTLIPVERIEKAILLIRGQRVMLDADLAALYGVKTGILTRAVRRNMERFPDDFMFRLTNKEVTILRSQFGISSQWGGRRYPPYAFTEHGVAMLSSVLRSERAVRVNIEIMRAFVRLRRMLASHAQLSAKLAALENNTTRNSGSFSKRFANSWRQRNASAPASASTARTNDRPSPRWRFPFEGVAGDREGAKRLPRA